ncbi:MAG TPA: LysM peptidoglycan-binding domain-containing protein [bacterium]|jgi:hypothetical protein|nr:LysM peptidoglycan-binding domain-containing protein [bacterium]
MKHPFVFAAAVAALGAAGCASQRPMTQAQATPAPAATSVPMEHASYVVEKGDSLWKIAGKTSVLGDPFRWPLLFKANRDQIEDPDFIQVSDDLNYRTSYTSDEIADAVKKAQLTPPYQPHKRPRKVLPIQY